ncbi:class I SAM-dependent rRNA methyltransferase [Methanotorris igneus]|uniref:Methyltransferase type 11 n=1 Tax=Methanotorris igneus (strain DSM 5666 / JCM 11834 / Kol 5) TaxID=880724 RepID=F6BC87_METIK|nr:class I SAM-dependent rRNA methyltransferase [Methanotorris igneus]AEF97293.1 Methyltransferase type 11 [Methanotorris igneus Kol 5]
MDYPKIYVNFAAYSSIEKGNLIVRKHGILNIRDFEKLDVGEIVDVYSKKGRFLGRGFKNPHEIRIVTLKKEKIDENYVRNKIIEADKYRKFLGFKDAYRMVYTQSDWLNGLVIDKYNDIATVQIFNYGFELMKDTIVETLLDLGIDSIYEKSTGRNRRRAGLKEQEGLLCGEKTETIIKEGNAKFKVTFGGQKTGFFLDQRDNRLELEKFIKEGDRVLDVCCYTGGFSVHAALKGAEVVGIDLSKKAVELAKENMQLNGIDDSKYEFRVGNAFEIMEEMIEDGEEFDVVILDPPAFAQSKKDVKNAVRGYHLLNRYGAKLAKRLLVTCSCSHPIEPMEFKAIVIDAALKANKWIRQIGPYRTQPADHPITSKGTEYLKCLFFKVDGF